uniref:Large ribosomal subunit protein uL13c n=1 Tax=Platysiphonia delicata TaxID=2006979 RepID=A0A1Z1M0R1_9FLOR|nr:ribosomal protein L13 [Platysiphonia delicata]ARW59649.1 ribosomal protein L13 [Platysiphonia delicata]
MTLNYNLTYTKKHIRQPVWYIVDAQKQTLGRLSSIITQILRGKNKVNYTPYLKSDIYIIIINTKLVNISGSKIKQKLYKRHSGRPGGMKVETLEKLQDRLPNVIVEKAIKGMLPKNKLGRKLFNQVKFYSNNIHPHSSQKPSTININ